MADCECLPKCPFFNDNMSKMPAISNLLKKKFCQGDKSDCARHMVFRSVGKEFVPKDLYPNDNNTALEIIKKNGKTLVKI